MKALGLAGADSQSLDRGLQGLVWEQAIEAAGLDPVLKTQLMDQLGAAVRDARMGPETVWREGATLLAPHVENKGQEFWEGLDPTVRKAVEGQMRQAPGETENPESTKKNRVAEADLSADDEQRQRTIEAWQEPELTL
jgi:hypothetical protein